MRVKTHGSGPEPAGRTSRPHGTPTSGCRRIWSTGSRRWWSGPWPSRLDPARSGSQWGELTLPVSSAGHRGLHRQPDRIATGPVGALARDRGILRDHGAPHPTESAALRGAGVVGAVDALVRPGPERHARLLKDFFKFASRGWGLVVASITLHGVCAALSGPITRRQSTDTAATTITWDDWFSASGGAVQDRATFPGESAPPGPS